MKQITCNFCGDTYPDFDVAHVCGKGPYAPKLKPKMNERIKEFARTSHLDVYGLGKDRTKWEDTLEKFTKLIVEECASVVEKNLYQNIGWNTSRKVKQHFGIGVEE